MLLGLTQSDLATASEVSRATIHRYEAGLPIRAGQVRLLELAIQTAGAVFIPDGTEIGGVRVYEGVGMRSPSVPSSFPTADSD